MNNARKVITGGALLALLLLGATWLHLAQAPVTGASPATTPLHLRFPVGERRTYHLDYTARTEVRLAGAPRDGAAMAGQAHFAGDLVLRSHPAQGTALRVGLSLENLRTHSLELFGHALLPDAAAVEATFAGREALLELDADGTLRAVAFQEADPSLFKNTVQALAGELQWALRDGDTFQVDETTSRGVARAEYTRLEGDTLPARFLKRRLAYPEPRGLGTGGGDVEVDSRFEVTLDASGVLERLVGEERVLRRPAGGGEPTATAHVQLRLEPGARGRFTVAQAPADVALQRLAPGQLVTDARVQERMLAQQVDGLTPERFFELMEKYANGGTFPEHNHFLLQATGLLEQQPELCARLADFFQQSTLKPRGRALVLDLLAGAGTPDAQAALVRALSSPQALAEPGYGMLLSRLSLLTSPTPDTVRFIERAHLTARDDTRVATSYALGATAGALYRQQQDGEALAAVQRLESELHTARTPESKAHLLLALGNAGLEAQVDVITRYTQDPDAQVRRASARALRKIQTPQALRSLLTLAEDPQAPVQSSALTALGRRPLDDSALRQLRDLALAGNVPLENHHTLVSVVEPYVQRTPEVRQLLQHLLTHDAADAQLHMRIRGLLGT
ncbi:HEAT repeat domain-containing protein [Myxococcus sp. SDU36]|uniref:HEAT repeat domain-containing protein n=1 Tax=Myxococcus sp. SDU36 TaxID=2831967 RepID=UPI0025429A12|nr:HEAT repeat domain-containing protein [Myxococcus sp. SDU36]WIG94074.1 HEAT repeat domain-containing protein [Myxococcus sp. SDU36]